MKKQLISLMNKIKDYQTMQCRIDKDCKTNIYFISIRQEFRKIEHYFSVTLMTDRNEDEESKDLKSINDFLELDAGKELIYAHHWLNTYCFEETKEQIDRVDFSPIFNLLAKPIIPSGRFVIYLRVNNPISEIEVMFESYKSKEESSVSKFEYSNEGVKKACDFISIMYSKSLANDKACMHSQ